jgi:mono/diheme cytochrome c family protein
MDHDQKPQDNGEGKARAGKRKPLVIGFAGGVLATLAVAFVVTLIVVYSGAYNVAATEEHRSFVRWALDTNFHRAVAGSADDLVAPEGISVAAVAEGGRHYQQTCAHCQGGPGVDRAEWALGMRPTPPELVRAATEWEVEEVFWLAKHGVRMTGMPAFGPTHDDETLWQIAAFVEELPAMTPEQYAALDGGMTPMEDQ